MWVIIHRLKSTFDIGGLCDEIDNNILHAAFIPFGELKSVELPIDRNTSIYSYSMHFQCCM